MPRARRVRVRIQPVTTDWQLLLSEPQPLAGWKWSKQLLSLFDLSCLSIVQIDAGAGRARGLYGKCYYPTENLPSYRIRGHVPGPFPCWIHTRKPPIYADESGHFPPTPPGCRRGTLCIDQRTSRMWHRIVGQTLIENSDQAVVWLLGHEAFHFLRHTRQIAGRNTEIEADRFADLCLDAFRRRKTPDTLFVPVSAGARRS